MEIKNMKNYNSNAPRSYNFYWSIQDEDPKVERMASNILLYYIQCNGQTNKERCEVLARVATDIGFNVEVIENKGGWGFKILKSEKEFDEMRQKIRNIRRGNFESEVGQIYSILKKYQKVPILQKIINGINRLFSK
jgi:hypothetical protein